MGKNDGGKTGDDAIERIFSWYKNESGEAKRHSRGVNLSDFDGFARDEIVAEERGERIAWECICRILTAARGEAGNG